MTSMHRIFALLIVVFAVANTAPPSTTTGSDGKPLRGAALRAKTNEEYDRLNGLAPDHFQKRADFINANKDRLNAKVKAELDKNMQSFVKAREEQKKNRVPGAPDVGPFTKKPSELLSISDINTPLGLGEFLWDGDQDLNIQQLKEIFGLVDSTGQTTQSPRAKRQTMVDSQYPTDTWTQGVPYYFDPSLSASGVAAVQTAIGFWQANTCLRFTQVSSPSASTIKPVVRFYNGSGCNSPVGRITDPSYVTQDISLGTGCDSPGIAAHEIGHTIGMYHGQQRADRDPWISINTSNINPSYVFAFNEANSSTNYNYGMRYDLRSIMHYTPYAFAINQSIPTIQAFDWLSQYSIGASRMPVFTDIAVINYHYKYRCNTSGTVCYHGGMPNPNNCTVCQCPSGFAGKDCSYIESPNGVVGSCGGLLTPTANWTDLNVANQIGNGVWAGSTVQANCTWHILAPSGKFVQFYVKSVGAAGSNSTHCSSNCYWAGVDIKWDSNKQPEGYRICCPDSYYWMNQSRNNLLIVQAYNYWYYTDFTLSYRIGRSRGSPYSGTMNFLMLVAFIVGVSFADQSCPVGTVRSLKGDKCFHTTKLFLADFETAENACVSFGGHLASVHDQWDNAELMVADHFGTFWLGGRDVHNNDTWTWTDGSPFNYNNWAAGALSGEAGKNCLLMDGASVLWEATDCNAKAYFICESPLDVKTTPAPPTTMALYPSRGSCFDNYCYTYVHHRLNWQNAEEYCQQLGGHLASSHSYKSEVLLKALITYVDFRESVTTRAWLGARITYSGSVRYLIWSDGSTSDYSNWNSGMPDGAGNCIGMKSTNGEGVNNVVEGWSNYYCDSKYTFICAVPQ